VFILQLKEFSFSFFVCVCVRALFLEIYIIDSFIVFQLFTLPICSFASYLFVRFSPLCIFSLLRMHLRAYEASF
jgi:hypothetical protein